MLEIQYGRCAIEMILIRHKLSLILSRFQSIRTMCSESIFGISAYLNRNVFELNHSLFSSVLSQSKVKVNKLISNDENVGDVI